MSSNDQLTIQFEGIEQDEGEVGLDYLVDALLSLLKVFRVSAGL